MAVDIANLGFEADTSDLERARRELENLRPAADRAERAADNLSDELNRSNRASELFARGLRGATGALAGFAAGAAGFVAAIGAGFAFEAAIAGARELSNVTAQLSTNVAKGTGDLEKMTSTARLLADEFGTSAAFQVNAFYDTVSAGIEDIGRATDTVRVANKLAIGGISDVGTAVDVLTTVTNAYAASGLTAVEASDALFIGMKAGKTTISELASSMGQVVPIASALGVSFDQMVAAAASLTLQGLTTSSAVTGLVAILGAVAKPTGEAAKLAKALGLEFSTTALRAKGFDGFLKDVLDKTGGSADQISVLFGSVEALNAMLAFSGAAGENFVDILDQMEKKAGATDEAFTTIASSLDARFGKVLQNISNLATDMGNTLLAIIVPVAEQILALINGGSTLIPIIQELGIALGIAFGPLILIGVVNLVAAVGTLAVTIGTSLITSIHAAAVALRVLALAHPFTAILFAITSLIGYIYYFRDEMGRVFGVDINKIFRDTANFMIALFQGTVGAISVLFQNGLSQGFYIAGQLAYNAMVEWLARIVEAAITAANEIVIELSNAVNTVSALMNVELPNPFATLDFDASGMGDQVREMKTELTGEAAVTATLMQAQFDRAFATDHIKEFTAGTTKAAGALTSATDAASNFNDALGAIGGGAPGMPELSTGGGPSVADLLGGGDGEGGKKKDAIKELTELQKIAEDFSKLSEPFTQATSAFDAAKTALDNGIMTNDQYAQSLQRIQDAFMRTGGSSDQWAKIVGENTDSIASKMKDLAEQSITRLGDEFINLAVDGKASFADLATSIVKDLLRIAWQAMVVKPIMDMFSGGAGGTGGGIGGLIASFFTKNAKGNAFADGGTFTNSLVTRPTAFTFANGGALGVMGEAGPEAVMPLQRGADGSLGVQMYGSGGGSAPVNNSVEVSNTYRIEGAVSEDKIVAQIKAAGEQQKKEIKTSMVGWLNQHAQDGVLVG